MTKLELLSPARTADIGIEAIRHGADAVYIGAPRFGARAAAGNSIDDISRLIEYAHQFNAKVYVTVNTIFTDEELPEAEKMIRQLYAIGVDALITQDMGLLKLNIPPIPLHASTQMDNRTPHKVKWLHSLGFRQIVLARELSLDQIRTIHQECPDTTLEAFVHGALCVSYSGHCYASECLFGRSANRGECAQICRMEWNLEEGDDNPTSLIKGQHLLSLKDMCQINSLRDLIEAGVTSFKIEGRLKDMAYVKNVTAAYSEALNRIIASQPDRYERASWGTVELSFRPDVHKSFNRGFTSYFLYGKNDRIFSFETPKAMGEEVGTVKDIGRGWFSVAGISKFANGDGLCFLNQKGKLFGFRVNKVENGRLYPLEMPKELMPKMRLFRNFDKQFDDILQHDSAERFIPIDITMSETATGFSLTLTDDYGTVRSLNVECPKELARSHQSENIRRQLSKLGGTIYRLRDLNIEYRKNWFIPSSMLSEWKRQLTAAEPTIPVRQSTDNSIIPQADVRIPLQDSFQHSDRDIWDPRFGYLLNIHNSQARLFYTEQGVSPTDWSYEQKHQSDVPVMYCRHCIRYALGWCRKSNSKASPQSPAHADGPLYLSNSSGRFRLEFDCRNCIMKLYKA